MQGKLDSYYDSQADNRLSHMPNNSTTDNHDNSTSETETDVERENYTYDGSESGGESAANSYYDGLDEEELVREIAKHPRRASATPYKTNNSIETLSATELGTSNHEDAAENAVENPVVKNKVGIEMPPR